MSLLLEFRFESPFRRKKMPHDFPIIIDENSTSNTQIIRSKQFYPLFTSPPLRLSRDG
jgi:hypothetical protein